MDFLKGASFASAYMNFLNVRRVGYSAFAAKGGHMNREVVQNKTKFSFGIFVPKKFNS